MPDRITETLTTLRTDVDTVGLADSGSVRRRGQQRTRNQVVGSTLAVVALVAGVVGVSGQLTGDNRSIEGPPATQGPSVETTPEPGPTTMDPPVTEVPKSVLLTGDDVGLGPLAQNNVNAAGIETLTSACLLGNDDLVDFGFAAFGPDPDGEPTMSQSVITQDTAEDATRQLAGFRTDLDACQERQIQRPGQDPVVSRLTLQPQRQSQLGEDAWLFQVEAADFTSYVVGIRTANASGILAFDADVDLTRAFDLAALARQRMTETFGA